MATDTIAPTLTLVQPRRPMTGAERQKAFRLREKAKKAAGAAPVTLPAPVIPAAPKTAKPRPAPVTIDVTPVTPVPKAGIALSSVTLRLAALALAAVGITMNGWFARSLGSTEPAGYLFLAVGVAADAVALVLPSVAAGRWGDRQRASPAAGWAVWLMTFAFAISSSVGFASINIADVTMARASRVTPAVTAAQSALADALGARDRECRGGVGRFCREREAAVASARTGLETAMGAVATTADPQTAAITKLVTWASRGTVTPSPDDVEMIRLALLALLPQIGGILLMVGRSR
jgi:hypothetical protein